MQIQHKETWHSSITSAANSSINIVKVCVTCLSIYIDIYIESMKGSSEGGRKEKVEERKNKKKEKETSKSTLTIYDSNVSKLPKYGTN